LREDLGDRPLASPGCIGAKCDPERKYRRSERVHMFGSRRWHGKRGAVDARAVFRISKWRPALGAQRFGAGLPPEGAE